AKISRRPAAKNIKLSEDFLRPVLRTQDSGLSTLLMIGKTIGNYEITGELASGGMGTVFRARPMTLPRGVVVKSIRLSSFPPRMQEPLKARFLREAFVQSQLDHPNIVRVLEFFTTAENYFLVMEYVAGLSLRELLQRQGRLQPDQALSLFK